MARDERATPERAVRRPDRMQRDDERCIHCGACEEIAPAFALDPRDVPVTPQTLDAMAACPAGAVVWREAWLERPAEDE